MLGNPYVECRPEPQPECRIDSDCPSTLACLDSKCQNPCTVIEPCFAPSECQVEPSEPVRTMICVCPEGYISSGSGSCKPVPPILEIGECSTDTDCPAEKACVKGICTDPCDCGVNAECRVRDHKPVCACAVGYIGNPDIECKRSGCLYDDECSGQQVCRDRVCINVCAPDNSTCGVNAECYGNNHRAICECPYGLQGNPKIACVEVDCTTETDCPTDKACVNSKCVSPCELSNPCEEPAICKVYNHRPDCSCPIGFIGDLGTGCKRGNFIKYNFSNENFHRKKIKWHEPELIIFLLFAVEIGCRADDECPSQTACINGECVNPCDEANPCGVNSECTVLDTMPVKTMICECLPGYQGNAAEQCDKGEFIIWKSRILYLSFNTDGYSITIVTDYIKHRLYNRNRS